MSQKLTDRVQRLKDSGKVRFLGMSSHERPHLGKIARGAVKAPVDFFHVRYNAVHTGAEKDVFPHLPQLAAGKPSGHRDLHRQLLAQAPQAQVLAGRRAPAGRSRLLPLRSLPS
jgi:aryl-alcohol dehydrogenase-like predicted oxidoreductase